MKITTCLLAAAALATSLTWQAPAQAQAGAAPPAPSASAPAAPPAGQGTQYTDKGADTCLGCHDADSDTSTFTTADIFKTPHAQRGNAHAPFGPGGLQCEACHGPGARHSVKGAKTAINSFKANSFLTPQERNQPCLGCHQGRMRTAWHVGAHERNQLACTDCHKLHTGNDAVLAKATQPEVCTTCHTQQRADSHKPSTHPVRFGLMACSDCHNPHGSTTVAMLNKPTVNQTCYSCHAEKRGPLLWEHAPVAEDCTLCHTAHGSIRPALLNKTPPLLCQQCHAPAGHPSVARTGAALPGNGGAGAAFVVAGSCTNCHSQVHGSNHPAGAKLLR